MIEREGGKNTGTGPTVPYFKLISLANKTDKIFLYIGWIAACITGLGLPSFVFLIGNVINSFDPSKTDGLLDKIKTLAIIFTCIGVGIWIFSYIFYSFLTITSERMIKTIKIAYLEAILR